MLQDCRDGIDSDCEMCLEQRLADYTARHFKQ